MKRRAPATERNRDPLAEVLVRELPESGLVLEVASGTGEHAFHFAGRFPTLDWQPSDPDADARASIAAWRADYEGPNLRAPLELDAASNNWPIAQADAILCVNMVHISPWEATMGLFGGAARLLKQGAPLVLYGPYFEDGVETAPSNLAFDASLKERNSRWGLRKLADIDVLAEESGFVRTARYAMPANNLTLVYRRV
ncbi:DUF938 domain-containing protein [Altererythrobacter sp. Z27]|uniref:DUF938 domain-containing protein n=1 Tax=Altererythrobacter sp. Z27 TaxID=3461147 RepID=UPI004043FB61